MIPCPGCGAGLRFDIETQAMRCDYCGATHDPYEFDPNRGDAKQGECFDTYVWVCPSCGGQLETPDETDAMGFCPYCGGASLLFDRIRKQWPPATVIPFSVTKEQCKQAYLKEAGKHPFVSKKYKDPALLETFRGIYMPYWSYRVRHRGPYHLLAESSSKREGDYLVSDVYDITGEIDLEVDGYSHDASAAFDDRISEDLAPFDPEKRKPFTPGFLSGFYTVVGDQEREDLDERVLEHTRTEAIRALACGNNQVKGLADQSKLRIRTAGSTVPTEISAADRTLYPVWFMSYRQGNKVTYAAVNGQTGKVSADFPASPVKVFALALAIAVALFLTLMVFPSVKARTAALLTAILFFAAVLILRASFRRLIAQSKALARSPEAARYKRWQKKGFILAFVVLFLGVVFYALDLANNLYAYGFCALADLLLIFFILKYISFQLDVAKRRPPQMNRKGALSDEK